MRLFVMVIVMFGLVACGIKGPLYLPEKTHKVSNA